MKILLLQDDFPPRAQGGAGMVAFTLAKALKEKGHDVFVITAVQNKADEGEAEFEGLKIFKLYSNYHERWRAYKSLYNPQTVPKIKKILDAVRPDVVHSHNVHYHLSYHSLRLAKRVGAKVFLTAHDVMSVSYGRLGGGEMRVSAWGQFKKYKLRYNPLRNRLIKRYLRYVDKIFAVSAALKDVLEQNGIQNVEVLHNGIDAAPWQIDAPAVRGFKERLNLDGKKIIFFGGRMSEAKGGEQAIRALAQAVNKVPDAVLMVAGRENTYTAQMRQLAQELGVGERLVFTGWISGEELKAAYHASDIILVPSIYLDSFPTIVLEAMACKKPVVGTCFGGAREAVADGVTGYIVNPFSVSLLADKISELLMDSVKAKQFGEAGYGRVQKEFSLQAQVAKLLQQYTLRV